MVVNKHFESGNNALVENFSDENKAIFVRIYETGFDANIIIPNHKHKSVAPRTDRSRTGRKIRNRLYRSQRIQQLAATGVAQFAA